MNVDLDIRPEHAPLGAILRETVERGERSRRYRRTQPLDDVAIVVVMRRLHQHQAKTLLTARPHQVPLMRQVLAPDSPDKSWTLGDGSDFLGFRKDTPVAVGQAIRRSHHFIQGGSARSKQMRI